MREINRKRIADGTYRLGVRMPSQTELARTLRVNHLTVRRALLDLVGEGLIIRRRGSGTYVSDRGRAPLPAGRRLRLGFLYFDAINERRYRERMLKPVVEGVLATLGMNGREPDFPAVGNDEVTRAVCRAEDGAVSLECFGESWSTYERRPNLAEIDLPAFDAIFSLSFIEED